MSWVARCPHEDRTLDPMFLILDPQSIHRQAQVGVGIPHIGLPDYGAPQSDPSLVTVGGDMARIGKVGKGERVAH